MKGMFEIRKSHKSHKAADELSLIFTEMAVVNNPVTVWAYSYALDEISKCRLAATHHAPETAADLSRSNIDKDAV